MEDFQVLIGGKAGFGIDKAGSVIADILSKAGYEIYVYRDYPSLIRGGHTFSVIRASEKRPAASREKADFILALNQDTVNFHKQKLKENSLIIYDSSSVKSEGMGISIGKIIEEEKASEIMRNTCIIGAFVKAAGIDWNILDIVFRKNIEKDLDWNLKIARRGFDEAKESKKIEIRPEKNIPVITGNEALGMGLVKAGLKSYIAYPMTPSSGILHFMASHAKEFNLKVIHPESEISVMLMALGFSYAGQKAAVGTSGGGFCLMTEGLSFSGMAELPVVVIVGQRTGPSTGLPTYTGQTELHFVLNAGQGEFSRFIIAPGDAEEAYYWSAAALNMAWKYQIPSIILTDKSLAEDASSFDAQSAPEIKEELLPSGLVFVPQKGKVIKANSYEHDENGITTEDPGITKLMQEKRLSKETYLAQDLEKYETVKIYGNKDASTAVLCWGSNKGVCIEAAENLNLKVIHPAVLWPFPVLRFSKAMSGVKKLICVENNATGQLAKLISLFGFKADKKVLKYDGRPFIVEELIEKIK